MSYVLSADYKRALDKLVIWYRSHRGDPADLTGDFYKNSLIPFQFRRFELKDALTPGGTATAYWRKYTGSAWETDTDVEFEVIDRFSLFRGRAKDAYSSPHNDGSRGLAWKPHDLADWEIVCMQPHALMVRGTANADVSGGAITLSTGYGVMQPTGGLIVTTDPAATLAVSNPFAFNIDSGGAVTAAWSENAAAWEAIQAACPA